MMWESYEQYEVLHAEFLQTWFAVLECGVDWPRTVAAGLQRVVTFTAWHTTADTHRRLLVFLLKNKRNTETLAAYPVPKLVMWQEQVQMTLTSLVAPLTACSWSNNQGPLPIENKEIHLFWQSLKSGYYEFILQVQMFVNTYYCLRYLQ